MAPFSAAVTLSVLRDTQLAPVPSVPSLPHKLAGTSPKAAIDDVSARPQMNRTAGGIGSWDSHHPLDPSGACMPPFQLPSDLLAPVRTSLAAMSKVSTGGSSFPVSFLAVGGRTLAFVLSRIPL